MKLPKLSSNARYALSLLTVVSVFLWAAWITLTVSNPAKQKFATVKLQALVNEYVTKQARSSSSPEVIGAQTKKFMLALDKTVKEHGKSGTILLVNEATVGSEIPDVTPQIRAKIYKLVPQPVVAANPVSVEQQMSSFFSAGTEQ